MFNSVALLLLPMAKRPAVIYMKLHLHGNIAKM
jgi:hypothetical protein